MPGLLNALLPYVYSQSDRLKRHVGGLLSDPRGSMEQTAGGLLDAHRGQQNLLAQAFSDPGQPFKMTDPNAMQAAAMNMLAGPLGVAPMGITAWHGSPHVFDKFDSSKIGTGEGAQAYGHGLYLAEAPDVAKSYIPKSGSPTWNGKPVSSYGMDGTVEFADGTVGKVADKQWGAFRQAMENGPRSGSLYKVDLPDDQIAKMLDWDKPLSQQPKALQDMVAANPEVAKKLAFQREFLGREASGQSAYVSLSGGPQLPRGAQAAQQLRAAGVPGIRYLDGSSRGASGGTRNFVVFPGEENMLRILERNGQALP